jgi:hypothetical protein
MIISPNQSWFRPNGACTPHSFFTGHTVLRELLRFLLISKYSNIRRVTNAQIKKWLLKSHDMHDPVRSHVRIWMWHEYTYFVCSTKKYELWEDPRNQWPRDLCFYNFWICFGVFGRTLCATYMYGHLFIFEIFTWAFHKQCIKRSTCVQRHINLESHGFWNLFLQIKDWGFKVHHFRSLLESAFGPCCSALKVVPACMSGSITVNRTFRCIFENFLVPY